MYDRVSARRMLTNSLLVGIHTALIAAITVMLKEKVLEPNLISPIPFIAMVLLCLVWWRIVKSYRQLNSGKSKVIKAMEQNLPLAPYDAEWIALGKGKDPKLHPPLSRVDTWVPLCFGLLYLLLAAVLWCKG